MEDRSPDPFYQTLHALTCPDTLDEMIQIVTNIRRKRMDTLNEQQHVAARTAELETSRYHDQLTETNSFPSADLTLLPASFVSTYLVIFFAICSLVLVCFIFTIN